VTKILAISATVCKKYAPDMRISGKSAASHNRTRKSRRDDSFWHAGPSHVQQRRKGTLRGRHATPTLSNRLRARAFIRPIIR